jgi:CDP-diacylglycerol--glycerol-3-phosphate 3-phosphatidyltransferase
MVVIALLVLTGYSGMNPWLILPATVIIFREVFVSGLREFLGPNAKRLAVTRLAKWKTTAQMVAISVLFLGTGLEYIQLRAYHTMNPADYDALLLSGPDDWNGLWLAAAGGWYAGMAGYVLVWIAGLLTLLTGWDYFRKALPYLKDDPRP